MKTIPIHIGAGGVSRHIGFNTVSANHACWGHPISLVCAFLITVGAVSAQVATEATVSGVYTLVTVNGLKLPAKVSHEGADLEVRSGTFTITADGKCSSKMIFVPPSGREATVDTRATYSREGPKLTMQWQGAGMTTGTVEGNTFTMGNEGMVFVYRKSSDSTKADSEPATLATKVVPADGKAAAARSQEQGLSLKLVKVDSEETAAEDGKGANAIDGDRGTFWHTQWQGDSPSHPHEIIIELTPPSAIKGFTYLPRQDDQVNGTIKDYEFYLSADGKEFGEPVKQGTFEEGKEKKTITFEPKPCRFIKLKALSEVNGQAWTSAAEIGVVRADDKATAHGEVHDSGKGSEPSGRDQPSVTAMTWEEFVTPGPAHKALEPLAGDWNVEAPWTGIVKATTRRQWVLGGRYLQEEFTGELRQNPYQGLGLFGYDNFRKKSLLCVDSHGGDEFVLQ